MMNVPTMETLQKYAMAPVAKVEKVDGRLALRSGIVAGAAMAALTAVSAAITARRERSARS
jgi:hypothetical protein